VELGRFDRARVSLYPTPDPKPEQIATEQPEPEPWNVALEESAIETASVAIPSVTHRQESESDQSDSEHYGRNAKRG